MSVGPKKHHQTHPGPPKNFQLLVIDQYHYDSNNGKVIRYYGLYSEIEIDEKDFVPIKEPIWVES